MQSCDHVYVTECCVCVNLSHAMLTHGHIGSIQLFHEYLMLTDACTECKAWNQYYFVQTIEMTSFLSDSKSTSVLLSASTSAPHLTSALTVARPIPARDKHEHLDLQLTN